jgi:putative transposase
VSYETIQQWCQKLGPGYARKLKRREGRLGDHWHLDEVFVRINGQQQYLWRAAERFFRRLLRRQGAEPLRIITDKLRSYSAAMRTTFGNVPHSMEP